MNEISKRDVSISMAKANLFAIIFALPAGIVQVTGFYLVHGLQAFAPQWKITVLGVVVLAGVFVHELIHGLSWAYLGKKPYTSIKYGFMWKTLTPYAHVKGPLEVNAYRWGTFTPGLLLGIIPWIIAMMTGNGNLFWFSLLHATAASGDWLVLWIIRNVKPGSLVEDHPTNAGCYALEDI